MKQFIKILLLVSIFTLGFLTSNIYAEITTYRIQEQPLNDGRTDEKPSPNDWIKEEQILVYSNQVILDLKNAEWSKFTDTHSMEPVLSSRANAIQIKPKNPEDILIGDIISYESKYTEGIIIHRVIDKGIDEEGLYFIVKGDNNPYPDPERVRFNQIKRVVVAIIY